MTTYQVPTMAERFAPEQEVTVTGLDRTHPDTLAMITAEIGLRDFGTPATHLKYLARFTDGTWIRIKHRADVAAWHWDITVTDENADPWDGDYMSWRHDLTTAEALSYVTHHLTRPLTRP